ncbi:LLM class flavin-dependent oxidoreductase [Amycolatopsis methanolica]|uniref:LLM class flavin-dependent oxidoreductase n=1 Tax=Amycolatopsis methanolica TaxID=1814 RepID=UPI0034158967
MKFGLITEAEVAKGTTHHVRYHEIIKEALFAEEMGFDFWGTSEQHMVPTAYTVSAPETLYGAVAALTSRMKIRPMSVVMLKFNHPIRIAERLATLDILTNGRLEVGTARSNNVAYLNAFGVDPTTTRDEWLETLEASMMAMQQVPFKYKGKFYDIDECYISPRPYSIEPPPVYVAATSFESHHLAGTLGIGTMTLETWFGWEYLEKCVEAHKEGFKEAKPIGGLWKPNPARAFLTFPAHVAETREKAIEEARSTIQGLFVHVAELYTAVAKGEAAAGGSSYSYAMKMLDLLPHKDDIDYLIESSPTILVGTPDEVIEKIKRYRELGIDEVILKIDNYGHAANMRSIEMFGKYVFPAINNPSAIPENEYEHMGVPVKQFML